VVSSERPRVFGLILAGTDGSERAEEAVGRAARLASLTGAALDLAYVIDTKRPHDKEVEPKVEAALQRAETLASKEGVAATTKVVAGDPAEALVGEAVDHAADLICVGPDAGILGGTVVGRVAAHVLRHAPCSVMVGRKAGPTFPGSILCGVDGSDSSVETAGLAARLAVAAGVELRLQHVIPVFAGDEREWTLDDDEPDPIEIESAAQAARAGGARLIRERALGRPEYALVETAERDGVDLVVVGSRPLSGVARVLLGSVSEYVAIHAHSSVVVARPRSASR
jgi:universal stress protein E